MTGAAGCWEGYPLVCDERRGTRETTAKLLAWARKDVCVSTTKVVSGAIDVSQMIKDLEASPMVLEGMLALPHIRDDAKIEVVLGGW